MNSLEVTPSEGTVLTLICFELVKSESTVLKENFNSIILVIFLQILREG